MRRRPRLGGNVATPLAVFYVVLWASAYVPSKIGATAMPPLWFLVACNPSAPQDLRERLRARIREMAATPI